jgi:hypothetical protein
MLRGSSLPPAADVMAEEVEALIDMEPISSS